MNGKQTFHRELRRDGGFPSDRRDVCETCQWRSFMLIGQGIILRG